MIRPAGRRHRGDLVGAQHRAGADQRPVAESAGEAADAVERVGRVERHLDDPDAGLEQGLADRLGLVRADAADDRDQRAGAEIGAEAGRLRPSEHLRQHVDAGEEGGGAVDLDRARALPRPSAAA